MVALCVKNGDFRQMQLLHKTMTIEGDWHNAWIVSYEFAGGYAALASQEFKQRQWQAASEHYYTAYWRRDHSDWLMDRDRDSRSASIGANSTQERKPYYSSSGMGYLRNAIAASFNAGDKHAVDWMGKEFLDKCEKCPAQLAKDETTSKYMQDVQRMMRGMPAR